MDREALHRFNNSAAELAAHRRRQFEAGSSVANEEIHALSGLAEAIGRGLADWRDRTEALPLCARLDARRAGVLVLESVFDEVLAPDAWRVLADALALVEIPPPGQYGGVDSGER